MKIVVVGGTGLIGKGLVSKLRELGHEIVVASPSQGVNTLTGEGLAEALAGAQVVVDVSNSPSFEDGPVMEFFETSTRNLLAAEAAAGVGHHVALSVVGTDGMLVSGYFRAKMKQETMIKESNIPYSIVRATQFFEFAGGIAYVATDGDTVRMSSAPIQPMAAADVSGALVEFVVGKPLNDIVDVAGPEKMGINEFVGQFLKKTNDPRKLVTDESAPYYGNIPLDDKTLVPVGKYMTRTTTTRYQDWLSRQGETS